MVFGNAIGLAQKNLKRLLAYSSIGHAGYLLVGIAAGTFQGASAMLFYLFVYTLATFGAFAVVVTLTREGRDDGDDRRARRDCGACVRGCRSRWRVFMLSLLGFPIFGGAGFFAKWYVLQAALQAPFKQTLLAVVLVLTTVVSAGYYLYVVMVMFMRARADDAPVPERSGGMTQVVLAVSVVAHPRHRRRSGVRRAADASRRIRAWRSSRRRHSFRALQHDPAGLPAGRRRDAGRRAGR